MIDIHKEINKYFEPKGIFNGPVNPNPNKMRQDKTEILEDIYSARLSNMTDEELNEEYDKEMAI